MTLDWTAILLLAQVSATGVVLKRLLPGRRRRPPLRYTPPPANSLIKGALTVVIPARNEEARIRDCLSGVMSQGPEVAEVLVIDDQSSDNTANVARSVPDKRIRVIEGRRLPNGWVGKAWALEQGLRAAKTEWVLCLDADVRPAPGLAYAALQAASEEEADLLFIAPQFLVETSGERWLHPALMTTLIYRLGPGDAFPGRRPDRKKDSRERQMISGPCFLYRSEALRKSGGFYPVRRAFAEDALMASHLTGLGFLVSFRNGAPLLEAKMYNSFSQTWKGWGVSLALNEVTPPLQQTSDILALVLTQAAPLPILLALTASLQSLSELSWYLWVLNGFLFLIRMIILGATAGSYHPATGAYWLSPLADIPAVLRIFVSVVKPPRKWRGRSYQRS
jgi:dolichol-phosphate mannosyltransferase